MIAYGQCKDIKDNKISTLSFDKNFDTLIEEEYRGKVEWTDITDDTAANADLLDDDADGIAQCEAGIEWLHLRNLIIPGETWVNTVSNNPADPLGPVQITKGKFFEVDGKPGVQSASDPDDEDCVNDATTCKWNPDGEIIIPQTNVDYDADDPSILSAYLRCSLLKGDHRCHVTDEGTKHKSDENDPGHRLVSGQTLPINTFYSRIKVDQEDQQGEDGNQSYIGSYKNTHGHFTIKSTDKYRPIPGGGDTEGGKDKEDTGFPGRAGLAPNDTTPIGCWVNLNYTKPFSDIKPRRTGALRYNPELKTNRVSPVDATQHHPRICQSTVEYPDVQFGNGLCDTEGADPSNCGAEEPMSLLYTGR